MEAPDFECGKHNWLLCHLFFALQEHSRLPGTSSGKRLDGTSRCCLEDAPQTKVENAVLAECAHENDLGEDCLMQHAGEKARRGR
eukprot:5956915-Amphidinium_carterae.1